MAKVYMARLGARRERDNLQNKMGRLLRRSGIDGVFAKGDLVAMKTHFGEWGNTTFLRPQYLTGVIEMVRKKGGKPFLTDANTLYRGRRHNAVDHLWTAVRHGFGPPALDAPVIIADGLSGKEEVEVWIGLRHCETAKIGAAAYHADSIIGVAHFKGHQLAGFGGALKNIGMGLGSVRGKLEMHKDVHPMIKEECRGCGTCVEICPADAIRLGKTAYVLEESCIGCGECFTMCPHDAIDPGEDCDESIVQEKIVEYCHAIIGGKRGKVGFINFVIDVTPHCDCAPWSDVSIVPDIGILASTDIVAIDQASADLVNEQVGTVGSRVKKAIGAGEDKLAEIGKGDWRIQLEYAESLGLGERSYEIVSV